MSTKKRVRGFTLVELLVVIAIIGILVALLLPAIQAAREAARRNACVNNMKQLGYALHTHHDSFNYLPLASSVEFDNITGKKGVPTADGAGYSWLVHLLPYLEEETLYNRLNETTKTFTVVPFNETTNTLSDAADAFPIWTFSLQNLLCPSFQGANTVDTTKSNYQSVTTGAGSKSPSVTNYKALVSSHTVEIGGKEAIPVFTQNDQYHGNGVVCFPAPAGDTHARRGLGFRAIPDGTSKTVILCESKEEAYACWYDGQTSWAAGSWGQSAADPSPVADDGYVGWNAAALTNPLVVTSLNVGPGRLPPGWSTGKSQTDIDEKGVYIPATHNPQGGAAVNPVSWGPSSNHSAGIVNHVFGDAHVEGISSAQIDKNVYIRLITRAGGEPTPR